MSSMKGDSKTTPPGPPRTVLKTKEILQQAFKVCEPLKNDKLLLVLKYLFYCFVGCDLDPKLGPSIEALAAADLTASGMRRKWLRRLISSTPEEEHPELPTTFAEVAQYKDPHLRTSIRQGLTDFKARSPEPTPPPTPRSSSPGRYTKYKDPRFKLRSEKTLLLKSITIDNIPDPSANRKEFVTKLTTARNKLADYCTEHDVSFLVAIQALKDKLHDTSLEIIKLLNADPTVIEFREASNHEAVLDLFVQRLLNQNPMQFKEDFDDALIQWQTTAIQSWDQAWSSYTTLLRSYPKINSNLSIKKKTEHMRLALRRHRLAKTLQTQILTSEVRTNKRIDNFFTLQTLVQGLERIHPIASALPIRRGGGGVCFDFQNTGKCSRGSSCTFKHDTPGQDNRKCFDWSRTGSCNFGDKCKFIHSGNHSTTNPTSTTPSYPARDKTCLRNLAGICVYGKDCRFSHSTTPPTSKRCAACCAPSLSLITFCRQCSKSLEFFRGQAKSNFTTPPPTAPNAKYGSRATFPTKLGEHCSAEILPLQPENQHPQYSNDQPAIIVHATDTKHTDTTPAASVSIGEILETELFNDDPARDYDDYIMHESDTGQIHKRMFLKCFLGDSKQSIWALADSGAELNACNHEVAQKLAAHAFTWTQPTSIHVRGINKGIQTATEIISAVLFVNVLNNGSLKKKKIIVDFHVLDTPAIVIGAGTLAKYSMGLQFTPQGPYMWCGSNRSNRLQDAQVMSLKAVPTPEIVGEVMQVITEPCLETKESHPHSHDCIEDETLLNGTIHPSVQPASAKPKIDKTLPPIVSTFGSIPESNDHLGQFPTLKIVLDGLKQSYDAGETILKYAEYNLLRMLFTRFHKRFVTTLPYVGGLNPAYVDPFSIKENLTVPDNLRDKPLLKPFKLPPHSQSILKEALEKDVESGYRIRMRKNEVQFASPCFPVFESKKVRLVGNFIALNAMTKMDSYPPRSVKDSIASFAGSRYLALLDGKSFYLQFPICEFTLRWTVWVAQNGYFGSPSMQMGLKNAMQHVQRCNDQLFPSSSGTIPHVDDYITHGEYFESFFRRLVAFLQTFEKINGFIKAAKLQVCRKRTDLLGYTATSNGQLSPDMRRIQPILDIPPPKTVKQCRTLVGLFIYYKDFLPNRETVLAPIRAQIKAASRDRTRKFQWTPDCARALTKLQSVIAKDCFLSFPQYDKVTIDTPFILETDASHFACGGALSQTLKGKLRLIICVSRTFGDRERNYHVTRKELIGIVFCLQKTAHTIMFLPTNVIMDHRNIVFFLEKAKKMISEVWSRYSVFLQRFNIKIIFRPGKLNALADLLSRVTKTAIANEQPSDSLTYQEAFPQFYNGAQEYLTQNVRIPDPLPNPPECKDQYTYLLEQAPPGPISPPSPASMFNATTLDNISPTSPATLIASVASDNTAPLHEPLRAYAVTPKLTASINSVYTSNLSLTPNLQTEQTECDDCKRLVNIIKDPKHPRYKTIAISFSIINGILMHRSKAPHITTTEILSTPVIPTKFRRIIFDAFHTSSQGAHLSFPFTLGRIRRSYWWPTMSKSVKQWCSTCNTCIRSKAPKPKATPGLFPSSPFLGRIIIDFQGPFKDGKYLFTCIIIGTLWPEAWPCSAPTAEVAARLLTREYIPRHGCPIEVQHDLGTHFTAELFHRIAVFFNITQGFSSLDGHNGCSPLERRHRIINGAIVAHLLQTHTNNKWTDALPGILLALRTYTPTARSYSADQLMYGHKLRYPGTPKTINDPNNKVPASLKDRIELLSNMRLIAADESFSTRLNSALKQQAHNVDDIPIGALVWFWTDTNRALSHVSSKHETHWTGPYVTLERLGDHFDAFRIRHIHSSGGSLSVNRRLLRRVQDDDELLASLRETKTNLDDHKSRLLTSIIPDPAEQPPPYTAGEHDENQHLSPAPAPSRPQRNVAPRDPGPFVSN